MDKPVKNSNLAALKKHPLIIVFALFLVAFMLADLFTPDKKVSELENRNLAQFPTFTWDSFTQNRWTKDYEDYTKDQFPQRDEWISTYSVLEVAQGKLEAGGVWYARDGYQIAKNSILTPTQQKQLPVNTAAVTELAQRYPGLVDVMIVPSPANMLSSELRWDPPQIDENAILDDMFSQMTTAGAQVIDLRPTYLAHSDEQLYYYTDHHWTTRGGAWLAYEAYCEANALSPILPQETLLRQVDDFYGTNFSKTKRLGTQPDVLEYYDFPNELLVYSAQTDGSYLPEQGSIMETDKLETYDKYSAFLRGNNGYSVLEGDGEGSVLVIKDSYGNCFVPYLLQNYATVGIIDLRAWRSVDETFLADGYDSILVLYSFPSFSIDMYAYRMGDASNAGA